MSAWSKKSLTAKERNALLKVLREEGIKPPWIGWCIRALGGEICRHIKYPGLPGDTGYQVIGVRKPKGLAGYKKR